MIVFLLSWLAGAADFKASVRIEEATYKMTIDFSTDADLGLAAVARAFADDSLAPVFNDRVREIETRKLSDDRTRTSSVVSFWGWKQRLTAECESRFPSRKEWTRECALRMDEGDAGRFMVSKSDRWRCQQKPDGVQCHAEIQGEFKPVKVGDFELVTAGRLALGAKAEAFKNQAQLWLYLAGGAVAPKIARDRFEASTLKTQIDALVARGKSELKDKKIFEGEIKAEETR